MFFTIAVIVALWCFVLLFGLTLVQAASRADEAMERQLRLKRAAAWAPSATSPRATTRLARCRDGRSRPDEGQPA